MEYKILFPTTRSYHECQLQDPVEHKIQFSATGLCHSCRLWACMECKILFPTARSYHECQLQDPMEHKIHLSTTGLCHDIPGMFQHHQIILPQRQMLSAPASSYVGTKLDCISKHIPHHPSATLPSLPVFQFPNFPNHFPPFWQKPPIEPNKQNHDASNPRPI